MGWTPRIFEGCRNEVNLFLHHASLGARIFLSNPGLHVLTGPTAKHFFRLAGQANNAPTIIYLVRAAGLAAVPVCAQDPTSVSTCGVLRLYVSNEDLEMIRYSTENEISIFAGQASAKRRTTGCLLDCCAKWHGYPLQASQALCTSTFHPKLLGPC